MELNLENKKVRLTLDIIQLISLIGFCASIIGAMLVAAGVLR